MTMTSVALKACHAADDGRIVAEAAVAVNLAPVGEHPFDVIEGVRPLRMARQFRLLPRAQVRVDLLAQRMDPLVELVDLLASSSSLWPGDRLQLFKLLLDLLPVPLALSIPSPSSRRRSGETAGLSTIETRTRRPR